MIIQAICNYLSIPLHFLAYPFNRRLPTVSTSYLLILLNYFFNKAKYSQHKIHHFNHLLSAIFKGIKYSYYATITTIQLQNCFHLAKLKRCTHETITLHSPPPVPDKPLFYFLSLWFWLFWVCHTSGIILYLPFCDCLISLSICLPDSSML